ncbi:hypothetical protein SteCoe_36896 [Stentor coeruleus]|uniref:HMG box domain-containing protein n=1 Tax=Stentor coeruleus TaxID=5963 RepID=A0A1R2AP92_9CILI|nr:hypothetical protein SteCoe_36896 [Stentor coeruleus]
MEAPKRYPSAYLHFVKEKRQDIIRKHPEFKTTDIVKTLGTMWNNMSDDEKHVYVKLQEKDKQAYEKAILLYNQSDINANIRMTNTHNRNDDDSDDYDAY